MAKHIICYYVKNAQKGLYYESFDSFENTPK